MKIDETVERHYARLERKWPVCDGTNEYGRLVIPYGNSDEPIHRWFHLKEAFSYQLVGRLVKDLGLDGLTRMRVLDCFAGAGTTLVSLADMGEDFRLGIDAVGIESNPFLFRLARAKASAATRPTGLADEIENAAASVRRHLSAAAGPVPEPPDQSTWKNDKYFAPIQRDKLLRLRAAISRLPHSHAKEVLAICAAATVESASRLRRDGRALRFEPNRVVKDPFAEFFRRLEIAAADVTGPSRDRVTTSVIHGDGRQPDLSVSQRRRFDLILFSPPYPNNIDYTEVYKTEAWYLQEYRNESDFRAQRLSTVRSHPSITFPDVYAYASKPFATDVEKLLRPIMEAIPDDRYTKGRMQLIRGYADDMLTVLESTRRLIARDGRLVYVVGNSVHGARSIGFVVAADLIMARLAELAGWRVSEIKIARRLWRRGYASPYLRESVVTLSSG